MWRTGLFCFCLMGMMACHSGQSDRTAAAENTPLSEITRLEQQLQQSKIANGPEGENLARELVARYRAYAHNFPTDSLTAYFLFRAGETAHGLQDFATATAMWDQVYRQHPGSKYAPDALFLQGFTMDKDIGDPEQAKTYYQTFLDLHPRHSLAADVRQLLQLLEDERSPEELIRSFQAARDSS